MLYEVITIQVLETVMKDLAQLPLNGGSDSQTGSQMESCSARLLAFQQVLKDAAALVENAHHNPVSQITMDAGSIELF